MSFSKAKIQRFNEIKPCAPGPTAYNVIVKDKTKGAVLPQVERFGEIKSPLSESGSTQSTPCIFRTPTLLKRKKTTTSRTTPKELFSKANDSEILREKIVECKNKDLFIKDLLEQIEDFKEKISNLEEQKSQIQFNKAEFEEKIMNLTREHKAQLREITEKFQDNVLKVDEEKNRINEEITLIKKQHEDLKKANRTEMEELKKNCDKFQTIHSRSVEEYKKLIEEKDTLLRNKQEELRGFEKKCVEMEQEHYLEIEKLQKEHQKEIQDIEFEMLKTMTELQKEKENSSKRILEVEEMMEEEIRKLQRCFKEENELLLLQSEAKVREIENNFKSLKLFTEEQLQNKLDEYETIWKAKLEIQEKQAEAILKECQAISEYNIIQCELEKNEVKTNLTKKVDELDTMQLKYDETVQNYSELDIKYKKLQGELSQVIIELNDVRKVLGEKLDSKTKELKKLMDEKRAYELTIKNSQVTIDVLKRRLINSDKDVEQLKEELSETETKILEFENKCLQLTSDLRQVQMFSEELEMQYESSIRLNTNEILQLKDELIKKVDAYKTEVESSTKKLQEEKAVKKEIMQQLHDAYVVINKFKLELECLETIKSQYEFDSEQSQNELEDYRMRELDWNIQKEKLENVIKEMENLLEIKQDEANDLKRQLLKVQENSDSHFQCLQYYKNKVTEYEKEQEETGRIHKKYIEMSGKYDELLQKFDQIKIENLANRKKCFHITKDLEEKEHFEKKYNKQKEDYDELLRKYEQLKKENCLCKKKIEEQQLLKERQEQRETERDMLLGRINYLENELKEVSKKYTDLVGHHNNHQKIKHLTDLKAKNGDLIQSNMGLELKLRKLKKENADLRKCLRKTKVHTEDKENIGSPNRSLNSSKVESPFRERN